MERSVDLTIVVCTRNRAAWLKGTLRALNEIRSSRSWELLLVDNASTDATADVIARADDCGGRLRYLRAERIGSGAARDYAWRHARGRVVAFTDDDCYPAPDFVDATLGVFDRFPAVGCVGGRILLHDPEDARVTIEESTTAIMYAPHSFIEAGSLHCANLSLRRSVLERIDGFDVELGAGTPFPCEDIDVVAATLWCGVPVRFDPAPTVAHHHRRRAADIPALWRSYDAGRGAYYAKYLLRSDTRMVYLRNLLRLAKRHESRHDLIRLSREMRAGFAYLRHRRAYASLAVAVPLGTAAYGVVAFIVAGRVLQRRFARLQRAN